MRLLKRHSHVAMMVTTVFFNTFLIFYYRCLNQGQEKSTPVDNVIHQSMSLQLKNNDEQAKPIYRTAMIPAAPLVTSKRILVVSYWRSGSTFLGALIRSAPGVFYSYEPLQYFNVYARIECSEQIESSIKLINALFQCKFPSDYFTYIASRKWGKPESFFMSANTQAQKLCTKNSSLCNDPSLYSSLCHEFPVHLMKTVRLPLTAVGRLIDESAHSQFKIVYLVRDPHGIMASRFNRDWCVHPSCTLASELCQQMNADLEAFQELDELYPNTFYKIRFEDFTANVEAETEKLFQFLGMEITSKTEKFLATHTNSTDKKEMQKPHSTIRDSKTVANAWRHLLNETMIESIDDSCSDVLTALNYERNRQ